MSDTRYISKPEWDKLQAEFAEFGTFMGERVKSVRPSGWVMEFMTVDVTDRNDECTVYQVI